MTEKVKWQEKVSKEDLAAAEKYLSLLFSPARARAIRQGWQKAPLTFYAPKDLLRASHMPQLAKDPDLHKQQKKIRNGEHLVPVLLVRDPASARVVIADGYHRICAAMLVDEDAEVPCKIV